ncbi:SCO family protein [Methylobacter sp. BBA5.1]|uniref:SCO family protein n=1 Tax=Methylobacter sp. BBA5.1 TaxID=1495064 RepID=UPI00055D912B|nr:SCO family protein [Methylobacter sp. BBA5.1]
MHLRYQWFLGIVFLWLYGESALAGDIMQGWMLSDPKPMASENPTRQSSEEHAKPSVKNYTRSEARYDIPDLQMVDKEGSAVDLHQLIDYGGPVMVQFIFATCSTICPVLSASFASAQPELDALAGDEYRLISISIDPEQDTPERLFEYAKRFKAGKNWHFLTGSRDDVSKILKAFEASYTGNNKMYHKSLTFMRSGPGANWIRIEGLLGRNDMVMEYKSLIGLPGPSKEREL